MSCPLKGGSTVHYKVIIRVSLIPCFQNQNPLYQSPEMKYENVAYGRE